MAQTSIAETQGLGERVLIQVQSESRPGVRYFVAEDGWYCSCDGFRRYDHCKHSDRMKCAQCAGYGTLVSYPKLTECPVCEGTGLA
jgi:hypothetical protein